MEKRNLMAWIEVWGGQRSLAFEQPRSQGSLLPALRSSIGRVGENPGNEVGFRAIDSAGLNH